MRWNQRTRIAVCAILAFASLRIVSKAQNQTLRVDVNLVLVNTTVSDLQGRLVAGLDRQNFRLSEDDVEQKVEYFSLEDLPISVGLVLDATGSMAAKMPAARNAALAFLKTSNPRDEYFLIEFSDQPKLVEDFTTDIARLQKRIFSAAAHGLTPLFDAVQMGLEKMDGARNTKKAILVVTDGEDNNSRHTFFDIREFARHRDSLIYAIGLVGSERGRTTIGDLVETSGGRAFYVSSMNQLEDICTRIAIELKSQYLLGYHSTNLSKNGKWRQIHVDLIPPKGLPALTVRAKTGYYAPAS